MGLVLGLGFNARDTPKRQAYSFVSPVSQHFAPFGIPHHTTHDIKVGGYNVPKNTQVMYNLYTLHMDPDLWEDPTRFDPDRFMPGGASYDLTENYLENDRVRTKYAKTKDDRHTWTSTPNIKLDTSLILALNLDLNPHPTVGSSTTSLSTNPLNNSEFPI